jgi:hypothetical protein
MQSIEPGSAISNTLQGQFWSDPQPLGAAARKLVEESFSLRATVPTIAEILLAVAALRPHRRRTTSRAFFKPGLARSAESNDGATYR